MIIEKEPLPFSEWLWSGANIFSSDFWHGKVAVWGPQRWLLVFATLAIVVFLLGWLVSILRHGPVRGTSLTFRVLQSTIVDLLCMSPRRVWALMWLAIRDALRRRVIVVFAVFIVILMFGALFLDQDNEHPVRLYISVVITTTSFLILMLVVFLSSTSLPAELKDKTLHTVVTKPVRPSEIVLGRILGFVAVGTVLVAMMGAISYLFVVRQLNHTHTVEQAKLEPIGTNAAVEVEDTKGEGEKDREAQKGGNAPEAAGVALIGKSGETNHHTHRVFIAPDGRGRLDWNKDHWHRATQHESEGKITYKVGPAEGLLQARVPVYGKLHFTDREGNKKERGINVGDEWSYRSYIRGGTPASAIWSFENIRPDRFPKRIPIEMTLGIFRSYKGIIDQGIPGSLLLRNPKTGLMVEVKVFNAKEFTTDVHTITRTILPTNVSRMTLVQTADGERYVSEDVDVETKNRASFDLFDDLTDDGRLEVWLQCLAPDQYFGAAQADLYLHASDRVFWLNFAKGYFGVWLQMVLVVAIGVTFSTFLSGPIAMVATLSATLGGLIRPLMIAIALGTVYGDGKQADLGGGPLESAVRMVNQQNVVVDLDKGIQTDLIKWVDDRTQNVLWGMAQLIPDLNEFSAADYVSYGFDVPDNLIAQWTITVVGFVFVLFVLGFLFLKTREVAK
ncbi:MAG: hypothetical protein JW818_03960 [Pirellulales bacterium]|nr:hypothetical protein [Pirellulales bacterium]